MPPTVSHHQEPTVAVVGCGAIGGVVASELARRCYPLNVCTTNPEIRRVWGTTGPYLGERLVAFPLPRRHILNDPSEATAPWDLVFVAVPPAQIEAVAISLLPALAPHGKVICLSNGWCEPRLGSILGNRRILGAVVTWGARMPSPGHYQRTSKGGFVVGALAGPLDDHAQRACQLLGWVGPVTQTEDLKSARMSKLAINCAVSGLGTVGGTRLGELLLQKSARRIGIQLIAEAVEVARAEGTVLQRIAGIDLENWSTAKPTRSTCLAQHALLIAMGLRYRNLRSSILASIERGRSPSIDYINGEISSLGRAVGVLTPYNDAIVNTVWGIARGEVPAGPAALERVQQLAHAEPTAHYSISRP
jgi:2-dehydropantoate 2-reductase